MWYDDIDHVAKHWKMLNNEIINFEWMNIER